MKKRNILLLSLLIFTIAFCLAIYSLLNYYLPRKVKFILIQELNQRLNAQVQIKEVKLSLFQGLVIYGIEVSDKADSSPIAKIGRLKAIISLTHLIKKEIFFSSISLYSADLNIVRDKHKSLNILELLPSDKTKEALHPDKEQSITKSDSPISTKDAASVPLTPIIQNINPIFQIPASRINVFNSKLNFLDQRFEPDLRQSLEIKNLKVHLSQPKISFSLNGTLLTKELSTNINISAKYTFGTDTGNLTLNSEKINLAEYLNYLPQLPVKIKSALIEDISLTAKLGREASLNISCKIKDAILNKDEISINNISAKLQAFITFDLKNYNFKYSGNLNKLSLELTGPRIPKGTTIENTEVKIETDTIKIDTSDIKTLNALFTLKGTLSNFTSPVFKINVTTTSLPLESLTKELKNYPGLEFIKPWDAQGMIGLNVDIQKASDSPIKFQGSINLQDTSLKQPGSPYEINAINGSVNFTQDDIKWEQISFNALENNFSSKGALSNFKSPVFNINLSSTITLEALVKKLKDYPQASMLKPWSLQGIAGLNIDIKSTPDTHFEFQGSINLKDTSLKQNNFPYAAEAINGTINFSPNNIRWDQLSFNLMGNSFTSGAEIINFKAPEIKLKLNSEKIKVWAQTKQLSGNLLKIEGLGISFLTSQIETNGKIKTDSWEADLNVDSTINLSEFKEMPFVPQTIITQINPNGACLIQAKIQGNLLKPQELNAILKLSGKNINLYKFDFQELSLEIAKENSQIKIPSSRCLFYGGTISLNGLVDLEKKELPYALKLTAVDIDLEKLKDLTPMKDKTFKGLLSSNIIASGSVNALKDVKAEGDILIKDGYLWEFTPLKKLGDFLFIPQYNKLIFREAKGNFSVYGQKVSTSNLIFSSDVVSLTCEGSVDFSGNLDLSVTPQPIVQKADESSGELEKFFAGIFSEIGGVVTISIKGTIQEPRIEKKIIASQVIGTVGGNLLDRVKSIGKSIFGDSNKN